MNQFRKQECKCHGVSGSCTVKSCWSAMQSFRHVGSDIKMRYSGATQVTMHQSRGRLTVANRHFKRPTRSDLVYLEPSPNYCVWNRRVGT